MTVSGLMNLIMLFQFTLHVALSPTREPNEQLGGKQYNWPARSPMRKL